MADEVAAPESSSDQNRYKRKRKKSFLKNARKYGKKGCYGRGSELDADTYQYFVRIMEVYREGFPSDEEKSIFVNNVLQQTEDQEINCSSNQLGCRVIQMLLPFASNAFLDKYMQAFMSDLRPLCSDRFASHVLETLVEVSCKRSLQTDIDDEFREKCHTNALKVSKFLLNNLEDYVWDTYGNHIIRTALKNLVQLPPENDKQRKPVAESSQLQNKDVELPEDYVEVVEDYAQRLIAWPQFCDLPYSEITSGLLQILLKALAKLQSKQLKAYIKKLLNESFAASTEENDDKDDINQENKLLDVFNSKPAMMLLELSLELAPAKLYTQIYAKCFINKLALLAITRDTNFSVQKLLNHCKEKVEFEAIFEELAEHFKEILDAGHSGVILALGQACKRLAAKQGSFLQNIMKCFNCYEPEERQISMVMCLCRFVNYEGLANQENTDLQKAKLNLHGTLMLQLMLEFNKPIKVVNSMLGMETTDLKNLFSNSMGSHIVDSYVKSQFVGEKSRDKLLRKMQGTYQDLASTKYGSRSFDAMWNVASLKHKMGIMNELSYKDAAWSNSEFGRIIASKVNVVLYKRNVEDWKNSLNKVSKAQALLADIIGE